MRRLLFLSFLTGLVLLCSCASSHVKGHRSLAEESRLETMAWFQAHGGKPTDFPALFDPSASLADRLKDARVAVRKAWSDLESQKAPERIDFMSEMSMMLALMLATDEKELR